MSTRRLTADEARALMPEPKRNLNAIFEKIEAAAKKGHHILVIGFSEATEYDLTILRLHGFSVVEYPKGEDPGHYANSPSVHIYWGRETGL